MSKFFIYCNYSILFNDLLSSGSRCRRVAVLKSYKVSTVFKERRHTSDLIEYDQHGYGK
jgi:hypothetical protein